MKSFLCNDATRDRTLLLMFVFSYVSQSVGVAYLPKQVGDSADHWPLA